MRIDSDAPAGDARYGQAFNVFMTGVQDLSAYSRLRFWARTENVEPWGGELSVELVETNPGTETQEVWRNTRWFGEDDGAWIQINLQAGASTPVDPWDAAYSNVFVVPSADVFVDGILDLTHITEVRIIPLTTTEAAQEGHSQFTLWVDEMTVE